jgi:long-chain acyl-CoA synthetase
MIIETLPDVVRVHAAERPDHPALVCGDSGRVWSYAELDRVTDRIAADLAALGVGNGDRIGFLDKNAPEYFLWLYAGNKLGAVTVAVNWRLAPPEMEYILDNAEVKVLLVGAEFLPQIAQVTVPSLAQVVVLGDPGDSGHPDFETWLAGIEGPPPAVAVQPEETCYQLYTSGTTGLPKGVELTHANLLKLLPNNPHRMSAATVNLVCMPLFHIAGSGWGAVTHYWGGTSIVLREVDVAKIFRLIPEHRVTHAMFVPAVLQGMVGVPGVDQVDFSSLELILYGASPITEAVLVRSLEVFGCQFMQAYGLTETTGVGTFLLPEDHDPGGERAWLLRSCGKPPVGGEVKIVDEVGNACPDGTVGEICIKGPFNMKGYWKNPDATAKTFSGEWFRTGDAGYMKDGYVFIHDRVKDMIISGGENIYPAEVENVLMKHPEVADCAVIGVPSEKWGETVKAIVTRRSDAVTEAELIEHCRGQLARYKCPTSVDWMDTIPRNPSGKILKRELRAPYWEGRERQV